MVVQVYLGVVEAKECLGLALFDSSSRLIRLAEVSAAAILSGTIATCTNQCIASFKPIQIRYCIGLW